MLKNLERGGFRRGSIDFLFIIVLICSTLYGLSIVFTINYLGPIFKYTIYYIYGRNNHDQLVLINFLPIRAPYLLW